MAQYASGSGPGEVTDDGCPVEVYRRIRAYGEADYIRAALAPGSHVLDLGAGTGRITHALVDAGYVVTAVDQSAAMLALIHDADVVQSPIETLDLAPRKFHGVLLASYLLNTPDASSRAALLRVCRKHVDEGGVLIGQVRPASILTDRTGRTHCEDGVLFTVDRYERDGRLVTINSSMEVDDRRWVQTFTHEYLDQAMVTQELKTEGFSAPRWLSADAQWFAATAV